MSHMANLKVDPFVGVANSGLATARFRATQPLAIDSIVLELGGTFNPTHITGIKVIPNAGKDLLANISGARLRDINEYTGVIDDSGHLTIHFGDPTAESQAGKHLGALDLTVYPGDVIIQVDIAGATSPTLSARVNATVPKLALGIDGFGPAEAALHRAFVEHIEDIAGATSNQTITPNIPVGSAFQRLAIFNSNLDALDVKKDGQTIYEEVTAALNSYLQDDVYTRVPQSGLYMYDRLLDGHVSNAGRTTRADGSPANWQFRVTTSAGDTLTMYADILTVQTLI